MSLGERLAEERKRMKLNQTEFGKIGGVTKTTQLNYEADDRSPNVDYWQAIAAKGADTHYILTGETPQQHLLKMLKESTGKVADLPLINECKAAIAQLLMGLQMNNMELITDALYIIRSDYVGLGGAKGALPDVVEAMGDYANNELSVAEKDLLSAYRAAADIDRTLIDRMAQFAAKAAKDEAESGGKE